MVKLTDIELILNADDKNTYCDCTQITHTTTGTTSCITSQFTDIGGIEALKEEKIAGVGLDVYDKEPLPQDHKLRFLQNALLLPHIGFVTAENYSKFYLQMIENLEGCLDNKPLRLLS